MKTCILFLLTCSLNFNYACLAQSIANNSFQLVTGHGSKDRPNGGCDIIYYDVLEFKKDSVTFYYKTHMTCSEKDKTNVSDSKVKHKTVKYTCMKNKIYIKGLTYKQLYYKNRKLTTVKGDVFQNI